MLPRNAGKAEGGAAMGTFAENMGLPVTDAQNGAAEGAGEYAEKAADRFIFLLPFVNIAGEETENGIAEKEEIENGKEDAANEVLIKKGVEDKDNEREDKEDVVKGIGAVSPHQKAGNAIAKAAFFAVAHGVFLSLSEIICSCLRETLP